MNVGTGTICSYEHSIYTGTIEYNTRIVRIFQFTVTSNFCCILLFDPIEQLGTEFAGVGTYLEGSYICMWDVGFLKGDVHK
jgi:hypothetical protein